MLLTIFFLLSFNVNVRPCACCFTCLALVAWTCDDKSINATTTVSKLARAHLNKEPVPVFCLFVSFFDVCVYKLWSLLINDKHVVVCCPTHLIGFVHTASNTSLEDESLIALSIYSTLVHFCGTQWPKPRLQSKLFIFCICLHSFTRVVIL